MPQALEVRRKQKEERNKRLGKPPPKIRPGACKPRGKANMQKPQVPTGKPQASQKEQNEKAKAEKGSPRFPFVY